MKRPSIWEKGLVLLLVSQLILPYPLIAHTESQNSAAVQSTPADPYNVGPPKLLDRATAQQKLAPVSEVLDDPTPINPLNQDDPSLDQDPFFLRSQTWISAAPYEPMPLETVEGPQEISYATRDDGFTLFAAGKKSALDFETPLHPVGATADFVVLAANNSEYFDRLTYDSERQEGIFIVGKPALVAAAETRADVPVFFLPLPGHEWTGNIILRKGEALSELILTDRTGEAFHLETHDFAGIAQAGQINLIFAITAAARSAKIDGKKYKSIQELKPLPSSTAAFGMWFTGYDLAHPGRSLLGEPLARSAWADEAEALFEKIFDRTLGIQTAHANGAEADADFHKMVARLMRVGAVASFSLAIAITTRIVARHEFAARHAAAGIANTWGQFARDIGSLFGHTQGVFAYADSIGSSLAIRHFLDRVFDGAGSRPRKGYRGLLFKFLDSTFYWVERSNSRIPTDSSAVLKGLLVAVAESVLNGLLLLWVFPHLMPWIAGVLALATPLAGFAAKIYAGYAPNPDNYIYARNETVRTAAEYGADLSSTVAATKIKQIIQEATPGIEFYLLNKLHLDPTEEEFHERKYAMLARQVDQELKLEKLPTSADFLYDFTTIWETGMGVRGYALPKDFQVSEEPLEGTLAPEKFLGLKLTGMNIPSLKNAAAEARRRADLDPGQPLWKQAAEILEESYFLANKKEDKDERRSLIPLTGNSPNALEKRRIPKRWVEKYSMAGARTAAQFFRNAFDSAVRDEPEILRGPNAKQNKAVEKVAPFLVKESADSIHALYDDEPGTREEILFRHATELTLALENRTLLRAKRIAKDQEILKPKKGLFRKLQVARANWRTNVAVKARLGRTIAVDTKDGKDRLFRAEIFAEQLGREQGIFYDNDLKIKAEAKKRARELTEVELRLGRVARYVDGLQTEKEKAEFRAVLYGENLASAYFQLTYNSQEMNALSPAQPGPTQKIRGTDIARNSKLWTRVLRTYDSFFAAQYNRLGAIPKAYRTIPGAAYVVSGLALTYRVLPSACINYWYILVLYLINDTSFSLFSTCMAFYFLFKAPILWLNQFLRMQGFPLMQGYLMPVVYGVLLCLASSISSPFVQIYQKDAAKITEKIVEQAGHAYVKGEDIVGRCRDFIRNLGQAHAAQATGSPPTGIIDDTPLADPL